MAQVFTVWGAPAGRLETRFSYPALPFRWCFLQNPVSFKPPIGNTSGTYGRDNRLMRARNIGIWGMPRERFSWCLDR